MTLSHVLSSFSSSSESLVGNPRHVTLVCSLTRSLSSLVSQAGILALSQTNITDLNTIRDITKFIKRTAKESNESSIMREAIMLQLAVAVSKGDVAGIVSFHFGCAPIYIYIFFFLN